MSEHAQEAGWSKLEESFELAVRESGILVRQVEIGGRLVELRFAGPALYGPLTRALAHLPPGTGAPELTLCAADAASTGVFPRIRARESGHGELARGGTRGAIRCLQMPDSGTLLGLHAERRRAYFWARSRAALRPWDEAAPFRLLLAWWAEALGAQLAHGAVVADATSGVLIAGPGGSGKSTLSMACLSRGLCTLGDDYAWIEATAMGEPHVARSLYCSIKLRSDSELPSTEQAAGASTTASGDGATEKQTIFLTRGPSALLPAWRPLRGVIALRIGANEEPVLNRASPMRVLSALAPSSLLQLPGAGPIGLLRLARLVRECPTFELEVGSNYAANAEAVAGLLALLSSHDRAFGAELGGRCGAASLETAAAGGGWP